MARGLATEEGFSVTQKNGYSQQVKESQEAEVIARRQWLKSQAQDVRRYNHSSQYLQAVGTEPPAQMPSFKAVKKEPRTAPLSSSSLSFIERSKHRSEDCKRRFLKAFEELKAKGEYIRVCEILQRAKLAHSYLDQKDSPIACEMRQLLDQWNATHKFKRRTEAECLELFESAFEWLKREGKKITFGRLHREMHTGSKWIHSHPDLKARIREWNESL
jgi:hypothetical protein